MRKILVGLLNIPRTYTHLWTWLASVGHLPLPLHQATAEIISFQSRSCCMITVCSYNTCYVYHLFRIIDLNYMGEQWLNAALNNWKRLENYLHYLFHMQICDNNTNLRLPEYDSRQGYQNLRVCTALGPPGYRVNNCPAARGAKCSTNS